MSWARQGGETSLGLQNIARRTMRSHGTRLAKRASSSPLPTGLLQGRRKMVSITKHTVRQSMALAQPAEDGAHWATAPSAIPLTPVTLLRTEWPLALAAIRPGAGWWQTHALGWEQLLRKSFTPSSC